MNDETETKRMRTKHIDKCQFGWNEYHYEKDTINGIQHRMMNNLKDKIGMDKYE